MATSTNKRRRIGAVLAGLAFFGLAGIASSALFTTEVEVTTQIESGVFRIDVNDSSAKSHRVSLSTDLLNPGTTATTDVKVQNTGTVDATVDLRSRIEPGDRLATALQAQVLDQGGAVLYSGAFADMDDTKIPLNAGDTGPGDVLDLEIVLTAPVELGNEYQALDETLAIDIVATQALGG